VPPPTFKFVPAPLFSKQLQAPPKDTPFYNALVCMPPSASVSKDAIGAIQMLFLAFSLNSNN